MMGNWAWLRLYVNWAMFLGAYGVLTGAIMFAQHPLTAKPSLAEMELLRHGFSIGFLMPCAILLGVGIGQKFTENRRQRRRDNFQEALLA